MAEPVRGFQTNEGTKQYDYNALANKPTLITQEQVDATLKAAKEYTDEKIKNIDINVGEGYVTDQELQEAIISALTQAKENGDFKGEPGDDYVLTETDKNEIANIVLEQIEIPDFPEGGTVDLTGYATEEWVKQQNYLISIPDNYVTSDELTNEVSSALIQAKQNGDFKGEPGDDYILTEDDKREVANIVLTILPTWNGGSY